MTYNTPENRTAFVARFACTPSGPWAVDDTTANKVLAIFDRDDEWIRNPKNLWSLIMQDRVTFMLGEHWLIEQREKGKRITDAFYSKTGEQITTAIYAFVDELEGEEA